MTGCSLDASIGSIARLVIAATQRGRSTTVKKWKRTAIVRRFIRIIAQRKHVQLTSFQLKSLASVHSNGRTGRRMCRNFHPHDCTTASDAYVQNDRHTEHPTQVVAQSTLRSTKAITLVAPTLATTRKRKLQFTQMRYTQKRVATQHTKRLRSAPHHAQTQP